MSEEAVAAAPEADVNALATEAAPVADTTAVSADSPVVGEGEQPETKETKPKTFTQEDVDRIVSKEKARVERKLQRDMQREIDQRIDERLRSSKPEPASQDSAAPQKPTPDKFATTEEYVEAVAEWKAQEIVKSQLDMTEKQRREAAQRQYHEKVQATFKQREEAARSKYDDFEEVAYSPDVPITQPMAMTIQESELGPELAYYLGKNLSEAERIARLSPFLQAKELGRLEAKLSAAVTPPKPSAAPAPISPIKSPSGAPSVVDTANPKSAESMSTSDWIAAERERQRRKWEAAHR